MYIAPNQGSKEATINRRIRENSTQKGIFEKNQYMMPCKWEPTGWRYPYLHSDSPPSTRQHLRPRYKPYKDIAAEKLQSSYFKTAYYSQYKNKVGFKDQGRKMKVKGSGFEDTDRLNEYLVEKGVPEHSNYISA